LFKFSFIETFLAPYLSNRFIKTKEGVARLMSWKCLKHSAVTLGLCVVVVSGCSWKEEKQVVKSNEVKTKEIVLLMPDNTAASTKYRIEVFQKQAKLFEEANPGVKIIIEKIPLESYQKSITTKIKEAKPLDIIFGAYLPALAEDGTYADLFPFFKADRMTTDDLYKPLTDIITTNGKLNGIPLSPSPFAVYYNKDWFDKAGISYPSGDWTWEQYFDISIKLKAANASEAKEVFGSAIPMDVHFFETLAQSGGSSILSPDNSKVSGFLDSRAVTEAFSLLTLHLNGSKARKQLGGGNPTLYAMRGGEIGMSAAPYGMYYFLENYKETKGKIGIASLPRLEKGKRANTVYAQTVSIAKGSKQKELAWKFVKDVILNGDSPFHDEWSRQELLTSRAAVKRLNHEADPTRKVFIDELSYSIRPVPYRNAKASGVFSAEMVKQLLASTSPAAVQQALTEIAYQVDQKLMIPKE
jgi:multiple sugar transport system substrate-binding protein